MKKFQNITKKQIEQNGVQALTDRPNSVGAYGSSGLSPLELKAAFDRLAALIAEKVNEIHNILASDEAAEYIAIALHDNGIHDLSQLVAAIKSGELANILELYPTAGSDKRVNLQNAIYDIAKLLSDHDHDINEVLKNPPFTEYDPTVPAWAKKPNPPTPAEIGAIAMFTTSKRLELPGWYRVGTLSMGDLHTAAVRLITGGQFNNSAHRTQVVDISVDYFEGHITKAVDTVNASNITKVRLYRLNIADVGIDIYYDTTKGNNVRVYIEQLFGWFTTNPLEDVTSLSGTILAELDLNECANPPMQLGVEYRTTERWKGKPVYVKLIDIGALPDSSTKTIVHNVSDVEQFFQVCGSMVHGNGNMVSIPYYEGPDNYIGISAQRNVVKIVSNHYSSEFSGTLLLKYTKTTN